MRHYHWNMKGKAIPHSHKNGHIWHTHENLWCYGRTLRSLKRNTHRV